MTFQVAVAAGRSNMIISVGPSATHTFAEGTSFGDAYPIYTIDDDAQYQVLLRSRPTYLCSDHQTIKPDPC